MTDVGHCKDSICGKNISICGKNKEKYKIIWPNYSAENSQV